jgi:hypothetical protein
MKKEDVRINCRIKTPRFLEVKIIAIFGKKADARQLGFTEPTHYDGEFEVYGRHIGINMMDFAAVIPD